MQSFKIFISHTRLPATFWMIPTINMLFHIIFKIISKRLQVHFQIETEVAYDKSRSLFCIYVDINSVFLIQGTCFFNLCFSPLLRYTYYPKIAIVTKKAIKILISVHLTSIVQSDNRCIDEAFVLPDNCRKHKGKNERRENQY